METPLQQIQQHCSRQLASYQRCVSANPHTWSAACALDRRALTECSEQQRALSLAGSCAASCGIAGKSDILTAVDSVDAIKHVKSACEPELVAYDACLAENDDQARACLAKLKSLYECARQNAPQPLAVAVPPPSPPTPPSQSASQ